jgi:hypothetical protein
VYKGIPRASNMEKRERNVTGVLKITPGAGDAVTLEFEPTRLGSKAYRAVTKWDSLGKHLSFIGLAPAWTAKILAGRARWEREVTILPEGTAWDRIVAR